MRRTSLRVLAEVEGQSVDIYVSPAGVTVNKTKVIKTDAMATNGVIHVIDAVVLPNWGPSVCRREAPGDWVDRQGIGKVTGGAR